MSTKEIGADEAVRNSFSSWRPHKRETWTAQYADLVYPQTMSHYTGKHLGNEPVMDECECRAGTRVRIVMVSRLGDVGVTERLGDENGYGCRLLIDDLCNFGSAP